MSSVSASIAQAVVAALNDEFEDDFAAERTWAPIFDPKMVDPKSDATKVLVSAMEIDSDDATREIEENDHTIHVGLFRNAGPDDERVARGDAFVELVERVHNFLKAMTHPTTFTDAALVDVKTRPLVDAKALNNQPRVFASVVLCIFKHHAATEG